MVRAEEMEVLEEFKEMGLLNVNREEILNDQYMEVESKSLDELFEYVDYEHRDKDILSNESNQRGGLRRRRIPFITGRFKGRVPKPNALQALASKLLFGKRTPTLKHRPHKKARPSYGRPKPFHVTHKKKKRPTYKNTKPNYRKPKQSYGQPKPTNYKLQSSNEQPKPTYHKTRPSYEQPKPTYHRPQPSFEQPKPTNHKPHSRYEHPKPTNHKPQSTYEQPKPTYQKPQQSHEQQKPNLQKPQPIYEQSKPTYHKPQSTYGKPNPNPSNEPPIISNEQPRQEEYWSPLPPASSYVEPTKGNNEYGSSQASVKEVDEYKVSTTPSYIAKPKSTPKQTQKTNYIDTSITNPKPEKLQNFKPEYSTEEENDDYKTPPNAAEDYPATPEASYQPQLPVTSFASPKPFYQEKASIQFWFQADLANDDKKEIDSFGQPFGVTDFAVFPRPAFPSFKKQFLKASYSPTLPDTSYSPTSPDTSYSPTSPDTSYSPPSQQSSYYLSAPPKSQNKSHPKSKINKARSIYSLASLQPDFLAPALQPKYTTPAKQATSYSSQSISSLPPLKPSYSLEDSSATAQSTDYDNTTYTKEANSLLVGKPPVFTTYVGIPDNWEEFKAEWGQGGSSGI
jgi:hypothetical protein